MLPSQLQRRLAQPKSHTTTSTMSSTVTQTMDMNVFPEDDPDIYDPAFPNDFVAAVKERDQLERERKRRIEKERLEEKQRELHRLIESRDKMGLNADGTARTDNDSSTINLDESLEEMLRRRQLLTGFLPFVYFLFFIPFFSSVVFREI